MSLSILIATVPEREAMFDILDAELERQRGPFAADVEILIDRTPRYQMPIGTKRNALLSRATKSHVVFFDDDDWPHPWYIADIIQALEEDPDCVGQVIDMTYNGQPHYQCVHSLRFKQWSNGPVKTQGFGRVYQRNITHRNPVRTTIARQVGFPDMRFGEDKVYSDGVTALCDSEVMIYRTAFIYRYSSKEEHNAKYGIR